MRFESLLSGMNYHTFSTGLSSGRSLHLALHHLGLEAGIKLGRADGGVVVAVARFSVPPFPK